ncbi:hypothetical protein BY996DRAFT_6432387 [Phakopsora pachyrhizi]|nr:hypothetical protein BY996DRAFT_6432387 [Phakopsora pachyrhizi]
MRMMRNIGRTMVTICQTNRTSASKTLNLSTEPTFYKNFSTSTDLSGKGSVKLVPFAGYEMALSYSDSSSGSSGGQIAEHLAVRNGCGLFDVSHMVQSTFKGDRSCELLSRLLPTSISSLGRYQSTLSVILNEQGGIIDDCILTRWSEDQFYLVTNAARRQRDLGWIDSTIRSLGLTKGNTGTAGSVEFETLDRWGLLALQGPRSSKILQSLLDDQSLELDRSLFFGQSVHTNLAGARVHISRTGYTGEDGFEISIRPEDVDRLGEILFSEPSITLVGLAARDSLRLEAGMCLYGNDLDETVGVGEAGLSWVVGKDRSGFIGQERTRNERLEKIKRRRVGLMIEDGPCGRSGSKIVNDDGSDELGVITSGIPSPTLSNQNIAMGYVRSGFHKPGTELNVLVRKRLRKAKVVKMPFVENRFHRSPKKVVTKSYL